MQVGKLLKSIEFDENQRAEAAILLAVIAFLVFIGPFGTSGFPLVSRIAYWGVSIVAGYAGAVAYERFLRPPLAKRLPRSVRGGVKGCCAALAAFAAVIPLEAVFRQPIRIEWAFEIFVGVAVISAAITGVLYLASLAYERGEEENPALDALHAKLPVDLRGAAIESLSAEDHYVRVATAEGEALLAGTFAEALEAARGLDGARVHRSWWIASGAVERLDRAGGRWRLKLRGDREAPVSRSYRPAVREMGWDRLG